MAGQLDLRLQAQASLQEAVLQKAARACLALEQDEREFTDLLQRINAVKIAGIIRCRHEHRVRIKARENGKTVCIRRIGRKRKLDLPAAEQLQHTAARSVQDAHMDMRVLLMVVPQEGQKIVFRQRAAHADGQLALQKLTRLRDALLPRLEQGQRLRRIVIEHAPLRRERHAARRPRKQPHAEGAFELLQRLADSRLRQIELLCRPGDISRVGNCFKYPVLLQLDCHALTLHQNY